MLLKTFRVMPGNATIYTNMYVVADEGTKEGILIDAAGGIDKIYNYVENMNIKLRYVILTHCHGDHIAGLRELKRNYPNIKIVINEAEKENITDDSVNMCTFLGLPENYMQADITVKEGDTIKFGNLEAKIIHTPGHTEGSMSILIEDAVFTGDTMFKRIYGRTDLKTGSEREIMWSIKDKLLKLPDNTIVYPGHGAITIIREEKEFYAQLEEKKSQKND